MPKQGFRENPQNINKNGRPKKDTSLTELLRQFGKEKITAKVNGKSITKTRMEMLVMKIWNAALTNNDKQIWREILNRLDGLPIQSIEANIQHNFVVDIVDDEGVE